MASNLSIFGASSSLNTMRTEKRKMSTAWSEHAKGQHRHSQQSNGAAWLDSIIPAPFTAPSNDAAMVFPMVGVNGAAPRWTTATALGASSRAATLPSPWMMTAANAPGGHGLQSLGVASTPQMVGVNGAAPLVVHAHAASQLVSLPGQIYGSKPATGGFANMAGAAGGLPLAATLDSFRSTTLTRMLSALMLVCYPPLRQYKSWTGAPPQWWPTGSEPWWAPEVAAAHLPGMPAAGPVPFVSGRLLKKAHKVAVMVAIVKHLSPDFARITAATSKYTLSTLDAALWNAALQSERAKCMRLMFTVELQAVVAAYGSRQAGTFPYNVSITHPAANTSQAVAVAAEYGGVMPAYGSLQNVANFAGNSGAHIGTMVTKTTDVMPQPGQGGHMDATFFSASDLGGQRLKDMLKPFLPKQTDRFPWYKNEELRDLFANMPFGSPPSYF